MTTLKCKRGYTLIDMAVVLLLMGAAMGTTGPLSRRVVARYQLNTAAHTLAADLAQAKIRAIQSNAVIPVYRESNRDYKVAGSPRRLPSQIRFDDASVDTVSYNGLGAMGDGASHKFILINGFGEVREICIYAAGGHEVRKL
jgi:type II secretory pathway pseudopilin PulG